MAFQVAGGRLYVCAAEPSVSSGGLEARATEGLAIALHPDTPPHDPADGALLRPIELLTDPAFATLGESARSWRVSGDLSVDRSGEVVDLEAGSEPCEVVGDTVPVLDVPYVAFLDVEVSSGEVSFGFDGPGKSLVVVPPGPARRVSTRVFAPRSAAAVTIRLSPGASCRVTKASLLRGKMLHEVLGLDDPLEGRREGSRVPDVRHVPFDPFRGGRR